MTWEEGTLENKRISVTQQPSKQSFNSGTSTFSDSPCLSSLYHSTKVALRENLDLLILYPVFFLLSDHVV